jgi:hypothetical protein
MSVVFWRKIVRGLKEGLTEDERYAVADHTVTQLKEHGDPWRLNEERRRRSRHQHDRSKIGQKASPDIPHHAFRSLSAGLPGRG